MKSLQTALTTAEVEKLVSDIAKLPSAEVARHADIITISATRKATGEKVKVLSAATRNGTDWHVMAVPGLITTITA